MTTERRHGYDADYTGLERRHRGFQMIDPREFGRLEAHVKLLQEQVADLSEDVKALLELANKSRGGMWAGMVIASALGGLASWVISHWKALP